MGHDDGTLEVYHKGIHYHGLFPFFFVFLGQAYYFRWACNRYINHPCFGNEDLDEQSVAYRRNIPLSVLKEVLYDLTDDVVKVKEWAQKITRTLQSMKPQSETSRTCWQNRDT